MAPQNVDPTRLLVVRQRAIADLKRRWKAYTGDIRAKLAGEDALGLDTNTLIPGTFIPAKPREWKYLSDTEKVAAFAAFLAALATFRITGGMVGHPPDVPWAAAYLETAYKRGVMRAYTDAKPTLAQDPQTLVDQKAGLLQALLGTTAIASAIGLIYARSRTQLDGVASSMNSGLASQLARGMQTGQGVASILGSFEPITASHYNRAATNMRTELTEAHADGQLDAYEQMGIDRLQILAEWRTGSSPCAMCQPMRGVIMTLSEARGLIPRHRNCRCCWVMVPVNAPGRGGQIRKRARIQAALNASVRAEVSRKRPTTPRPVSIWRGAWLRPTQKNPPRRPRP